MRALKAEAERRAVELKSAPANSARMAELVNSYPQMSDLASKISNHVSGQIDHELAALQEATQLAQQNLFWQTLLLVPMTLAVVGVFTYLFGRPIRAIDRSINELGRGTFSQAHRHSRPGGPGAARRSARMAAGAAARARAREESILATHVS